MPTIDQRKYELQNMKLDFSSGFTIKADSSSDEELTIEGFASTDTRDRAGDIIPPSAWADPEALMNYMKNPIVLAQHDRSMPVGKCNSLQIKDGGLYVSITIIKSLDERTFNAVKAGVLKSFSVGFRLKDLEYDENLDSFILTKVELTEISIVSIPCNTDATFAVIKSLTSGGNKTKEKKMPAGKDENNQVVVTASPTDDQIKAAVEQQVTAQIARIEKEKADAAAAQAQAQAEKEALQALIASEAKKNAEDLIKQITAAFGAEGDQAKLSEVIAKFKGDIDGNREAVIAAQQTSKMEHPAKATGRQGPVSDEQKGYAVLLGIVTKKATFDTKFGNELRQKAAGFDSSNAAVHIPGAHTVDAAEWETTFVTNLWYDVRRELVVEPMFRSIQMTTATMRLPVVPEQGYASYIPVDLLKTSGSTAAPDEGNRPTELTLIAHKLSASDILGAEETEDTIIAILPLIRDNLVRRMARSSDRSLLRGVGATAADPIKGLAKYAIDNSKTTTLSIGGGDKLTALGLQQARRLLGVYGIRPSDVAYIISTDGYYDLLEDPDMRKYFDVGPDRATILKGEVANVNGSKIVVSDEWAAKAAGNTAAVVVNMRNYVIGNLRNLTVKTDERIEIDGTLIIATRRFGMIEMEAGGVAAIQWAA